MFKLDSKVLSKQLFSFDTVETKEIEQEVINSKVIKADIETSFAEVLKQFELNVSKESKIEEMEAKLESFKEVNQKIYDKIENLKSVGLTNTPTVREKLAQLEGDEKRFKNKIDVLKAEIKEAQDLQNKVSEYKIKYPGYKFVSREVMIEIMKKYDLVMGEAFTYAKEIPDDSLEIIAKFKDEIEESKKTFQLKNFDDMMYTFEEVINTKRESSDNFYGRHIPHVNSYPTYTVGEYEISKFKMVAPESHFKIPEVDVLRRYRFGNSNSFENLSVPIMKYGKNRIFQFNTEELEKIAKNNREVLDPIACLKVDKGFIIMTAWDEEAEIPEIQNEILN